MWNKTAEKALKTLCFSVKCETIPIGREAACPSARLMARDEARHGKAFAGLLNRYFGK